MTQRFSETQQYHHTLQGKKRKTESVSTALEKKGKIARQDTSENDEDYEIETMDLSKIWSFWITVFTKISTDDFPSGLWRRVWRYTQPIHICWWWGIWQASWELSPRTPSMSALPPCDRIELTAELGLQYSGLIITHSGDSYIFWFWFNWSSLGTPWRFLKSGSRIWKSQKLIDFLCSFLFSFQS